MIYLSGQIAINPKTNLIVTDSIENRTLLYHYDNEEISDLFIDRETLPIFTAFRPYIVEVTTNNLGPELNNDATGVGEWVFKNYGRTTSLRGRRYLNDRAINLDLIIIMIGFIRK